MHHHRTLLALCVLVLRSLLAPAAGHADPAPAAAVHVDPAAKQRGVSWVAGEEIGRAELEALVRHHVDWIVQTPFGWQSGIDSPEIRLLTDGRIYWGERDVGLIATTRMARELGIKTLLKPHLWLSRAGDKWRTDIAMPDEETWLQWFASYRVFILHYARLAEAEGIEALAVGTELHQTAVRREADWRRLIAEIRQVYSGELTYAGNWWKEFEEIEFWDALDWIGVQAYFPLTEKTRPTVEELILGWRPHVEALERVSRRFGKPIVFTEVGYKSAPGAAIKPWEWMDSSRIGRDEPDFQIQADAYEAFFLAVWDKPWCAGAYFWKWFPKTSEGSLDLDFTPQGKPAAQVMARWYAQGKAEPPTQTTGE